MKPLIGVTCNYGETTATVYNTYSRAVAAGGGLPMVLPDAGTGTLVETLDRLDGVLITGGGDIPPERYGDEKHPNAKLVTPERDAFDAMLLEELRKRELPTLGICYGIQALSVAFGGTLWQDIPDQLPEAIKHHRDRDKGEPRQLHMVRIEKGTQLHRILGVDRLETNSSHHQALREVPSPLRATAFCEADGIVEAVENPEHRFMLGIQWHPESLIDRALHLKLFEAFVAEASR